MEDLNNLLSGRIKVRVKLLFFIQLFKMDVINNFHNRASILSPRFIDKSSHLHIFFRSRTELEHKEDKTTSLHMSFLAMMRSFNFGLRGNYPTHPPTPSFVKRIMLQSLRDNIGNHISGLAQDMLLKFRGFETFLIRGHHFEFIASLSWIKDIVAVNSFQSNSRQGAVNSLTLRNIGSGNPRAYYFYAIMAHEANFIAVEFHCEESNSNQSECEVFDSDSDHIFLEIDVYLCLDFTTA